MTKSKGWGVRCGFLFAPFDCISSVFLIVFQVPRSHPCVPAVTSGGRCPKAILAGHFVRSLIGELITESMVLSLVDKDKDSYIYPLDFFMTLFKVSE